MNYQNIESLLTARLSGLDNLLSNLAVERTRLEEERTQVVADLTTIQAAIEVSAKHASSLAVAAKDTVNTQRDDLRQRISQRIAAVSKPAPPAEPAQPEKPPVIRQPGPKPLQAPILNGPPPVPEPPQVNGAHPAPALNGTRAKGSRTTKHIDRSVSISPFTRKLEVFIVCLLGCEILEDGAVRVRGFNGRDRMVARKELRNRVHLSPNWIMWFLSLVAQAPDQFRLVERVGYTSDFTFTDLGRELVRGRNFAEIARIVVVHRTVFSGAPDPSDYLNTKPIPTFSAIMDVGEQNGQDRIADALRLATALELLGAEDAVPHTLRNADA